MKEDSETLGEVVVTAFGTGQKKESIVGSIQTVRPNDLKVPSANLSNSLPDVFRELLLISVADSRAVMVLIFTFVVFLL